ncbi:MlaD family protein [Culturomica massiliensis]|jgi:phospholipid/cholesterol/gamma-HCH transport system substrate-binding protein|uniref:MlaD family protein n=1 Tax=Culturomica massiliensis TaxID=1841857 RepID=UPI000837FADF|nr:MULTISPECIES: MlaD family protein [Odoribacteraceae]RHV90823.1 MCE family protein [Odoribacter sp. OF09-27XD]
MKIRKEVKLAITAIAAVVILIWGINFLKAKALFDRNNMFYGVYERVDGLKVSSSVVYRGYHVGQVNAIRFIGKRFDRVLVQFSIGKNLEIPANSIAAIQSTDLMGSKAINIIPGNALAYANSGDTLKTQIELGLIEQMNKQIQPLKLKAENILSSLDSVLTDIQEVFNSNTKGNIEKSLQSVRNTLSNVEHASAGLDQLITGQSSQIASILENVNSISANLRENNHNISRGIDNIVVISDSLRSVNLNQTVHRLNGILEQLDSITRKINRGKGTFGEMVNDDDLYYNLTAVSENLNKLLVDFRSDPKRFVNLSLFDFGGSGKQGKDNYGIAIYESEKPLPLTAELYLKYPDLKEIKRHGRFFYLIGSYATLKRAEKDLTIVNKAFKDAFIVKISQN